MPNPPSSSTSVIPAMAKRLFRNQVFGIAAVLVLICAVSALLSPYFLSGYNLSVVARGLAFVALITIGQASLMILGELDLSLGTIGGLAGVVSGMLMVQAGFPPAIAILLAILLGACLGMVNGVLVTQLRLHSLVLTIGTAGIFGGAILVLTRGVAITGIPREIQWIGRGDLLGVPSPFIIAMVLLVIAVFVTMRLPFGRYMYAIGNNSDAAKMLGIPVNWVRIWVFTGAGGLAALAGVLMVARLGTAQPSIGAVWVLGPIAAAVIGGVATTGGVGTLTGAILGAAIIAVIENVIVLTGVSPYWQGIVSGVIVVFAISFDSISRQILNQEKRR